MSVGPKRGPFRGPTPTRRRLIAPATVVVAVAIDWFAPLSTPPAHWSEPGLSAAWTQYVTGVTIPRTDRLDWFQSLSEPVRAKPDIRWREPFTTDPKPFVPAFIPPPFSDPPAYQIERGLSAAWT